LKEFEAAAKADPKDPRAPYLRGVALEKKGDAAGAEKAYREAVARDARFPPAHNNLGAMLIAKGDWAAAEKELQAAVKADPRYADAHIHIGLLRDADREHPRGGGRLPAGGQARPEDPSIHLNLGRPCGVRAILDGAIAEVQQATRLGPKDAVAWSTLGLLYSDKKAYDEAQAALHKATLLGPQVRGGLVRPGPGGAAPQAAGTPRRCAGEGPQAGAQEPRHRRRPLPRPWWTRDPLGLPAPCRGRAALALEPATHGPLGV
jgi:tetratricopeptide (TPR) repeat protein